MQPIQLEDLTDLDSDPCPSVSDIESMESLPNTTKVADPSTLEGQKAGAILKVKWVSEVNGCKVDDHVQVLRHCSGDKVVVKNLRTSEMRLVDWQIFFPAPFLATCGCHPTQCRCVHETVEAFTARKPSEEDRFDAQKRDPWSFKGQAVGVNLTVRQKPSYEPESRPLLAVEVHDLVKVLEFSKTDSMEIRARNLRTGNEGYMSWSSFEWVGVREICGCEEWVCRCEYKNFRASMKFAESL